MVATAEIKDLKTLYLDSRLAHATSHKLSAIEEEERARAAASRLPADENPLIGLSASNEALEKTLAQMHTGYQNLSPFRRFEEIKKDTEKRKPKHKLGKGEIIKRFEQQKLI